MAEGIVRDGVVGEGVVVESVVAEGVEVEAEGVVVEGMVAAGVVAVSTVEPGTPAWREEGGRWICSPCDVVVIRQTVQVLTEAQSREGRDGQRAVQPRARSLRRMRATSRLLARIHLRARLIRIYDRREDDPIVPVDKLPQRVLERVEPFVAVLARGHVGKYVWQLWQRKEVLLLHSKRLTSKVVPFLRSRKPWRQHLPAQRHQPNGKCLAEQVAPTDAACVVREEARHSHPVHSHLVVYYQLPVEHSLTQDALAIAAWEVHRG